MIVFVVEQLLVPDILPDLEKAVDSWRAAAQLKFTNRSFSDGYCHPGYRSNINPKRFKSAS